MKQKDWSSQLARYPYAAPFIPRWCADDHTHDSCWPDYEHAFNIYIDSKRKSRTLVERYKNLKDSQQIFRRLEEKGDDHLATRLALIRIHVDLNEQEEAVKSCQRLMEQLPQIAEHTQANESIDMDRPFLTPLSQHEHLSIETLTNDWLSHALCDAVEQLTDGLSKHPNTRTDSSIQSTSSQRNASYPTDDELDISDVSDGMAIVGESQSSKIEPLQDQFLQAIKKDRSDVSNYLLYAHALLEANDIEEAWFAFHESQRLEPLCDADRVLMESLKVDIGNRKIRQYLERTGSKPISRSEAPKRILVVTNLLPPQEMGGFGRTMWEFCRGLLRRGHDLSILTADMPHLFRESTDDIAAVEKYVKRDLKLFGDWKDGKTVTDTDEVLLKQKVRHNYQQILAEAARFRPSGCLVGNLNFLGYGFLELLLQRNIPIVHRLGNSLPGYPVASTPRSPLYCLAGATNWLNQQLESQGYQYTSHAVIYPGSTLDIYYRYIPPAFDELRICYAGLLMPYKGAQVLLAALAILKTNNIPFTCVLAGDTTDPSFVAELVEIARRMGFSDRLHVTGFLHRADLARLYDRSNVMVFPSLVEEAFGKTQIEAMASGLAVVSSGTGGAREVVADRKNGLIFERGNPRDLAEKLVSLYRDPMYAMALAAQGHKDAFRFTTACSVEKIERVFDMLSPESTTRQSTRPQSSALLDKMRQLRGGPKSALASVQRISESTSLIDASDLSGFHYSNPEGIVVLMPVINVGKAISAATILERRAGISCAIFLLHDTVWQGFMKTINSAFRKVDCKYVVYLAEDAFPGQNWLQSGFRILEEQGKSLLAFNDGKWNGRTASFGMVRKKWVERFYRGDLFYPGYVSHAGDDELTMLARATDAFAYDPECTLVEIDIDKDFKTNGNAEDTRLISERFSGGFDGMVPIGKLGEIGQYHGLVLANGAE